MAIATEMWPTLPEKCRGAILEQYFLYLIHKINLLRHLENENWFYLYQKVGNSSLQHCWECQDAPPCAIRARYSKLCHKYGHNYVIWLESYESSYTIVRSVNKICFYYPITGFLFSLSTSTHISTPCERISFFQVFFIFF